MIGNRGNLRCLDGNKCIIVRDMDSSMLKILHRYIIAAELRKRHVDINGLKLNINRFLKVIEGTI